MYERFTDRARKVMALANLVAHDLNHVYLGTEHILLGLLSEGTGAATRVLKNMDVDLRKVRLEVEKLGRPGPDVESRGKLPMTPRAKKVIEFAIEESHVLGHNYVGTEHLLLGLLREHDGVAAQALMFLGLKLEEVREQILSFLGHHAVESEIWPEPPNCLSSTIHPFDEWFSRTYPGPQPPSVLENAMFAWNAAIEVSVYAARETLSTWMTRLLDESKYKDAAIRQVLHDLQNLAKQNV